MFKTGPEHMTRTKVLVEQAVTEDMIDFMTPPDSIACLVGPSP